MSVKLLVEKIKPLDNGLLIKAILPNGCVVDMSTQQYVVDGNYHMFAKTSEHEHYDMQHTVGALKKNLEYEASDSCWRTNGNIFDDGILSDFLDCGVYVVTGDYDAFHGDSGIGYMCYEAHGFKVENGIMYLMCDNVSEIEPPVIEGAALVDAIQVRVEGGYIVARKSPDTAYPGIDVEFVPDHEDGEALSVPRVLMEKASGQPLRALVWGNKAVEDYTAEIRFE